MVSTTELVFNSTWFCVSDETTVHLKPHVLQERFVLCTINRIFTKDRGLLFDSFVVLSMKLSYVKQLVLIDNKLSFLSSPSCEFFFVCTS